MRLRPPAHARTQCSHCRASGSAPGYSCSDDRTRAPRGSGLPEAAPGRRIRVPPIVRPAGRRTIDSMNTPPDHPAAPPTRAPRRRRPHVRAPRPWRFVRREHGRSLAGVATGMADAFHIDVPVVRVIWVIVDARLGRPRRRRVRDLLDRVPERRAPGADQPAPPDPRPRGRGTSLGVVLLGIGVDRRSASSCRCARSATSAALVVGRVPHRRRTGRAVPPPPRRTMTTTNRSDAAGRPAASAGRRPLPTRQLAGCATKPIPTDADHRRHAFAPPTTRRRRLPRSPPTTTAWTQHAAVAGAAARADHADRRRHVRSSPRSR